VTNAARTPGSARPRHRRGHRTVMVLLVFVQLLLVVAALAVPLSFAWLRQEARRLGLQALVGPGASEGTLGRLSTEPVLLVLAFHNIEKKPHSPYSVTPNQFADHMHMLVKAGYTAASAQDIQSALAQRAITGHKVLITFDDGARGIWTYADPVLARYHLRAMAFVITGQVGRHQPYYVTWPELRAMHRSGRWDLESHTNLGHGTVTDSPTGGEGPFLASLQWLPKLGRYETVQEYRRRATADLDASRVAFVKHHLPQPRFFAFPFSATGHSSNDRRVPQLLRSVVAAEFVAAFENEASAAAVSPHDLAERLLPRIEVTGEIPTRTLYGQLHQASPLGVAEANLDRATDWCCLAGAPNVDVDRHGSFRLLGKSPSWRLSTYGPGRASGWASYIFQATAHGLTAHGTAAAVLVRTDGHAALRVTVSRARARVLVTNEAGGTSELSRQDTARRDSHAVTVTVTRRGTNVAVDGEVLRELPGSHGPLTGSVGLGVSTTSTSTDPWFDHVQIQPTQ
jgi:biofilm PGA synthesis lipoprotein PgaB